MNVETKMYLVGLLESYQKRAKQIEFLHYELSHPVRVSENEIIGALALAHRDGEGGHPGGHASDKILYIALNYQTRAHHVNSDIAEKVVGQFVTLEQVQEWLNDYVSLLKPRHAQLLKLLYFEDCSQEECATELKIATRTVRRIKDEAIMELEEMYSFTGEAAGRTCPGDVQ